MFFLYLKKIHKFEKNKIMIDSIIQSLASKTGQELVSNIGIPPNLLDDLFKITGNVAEDEIKNQISKGGLDTVMNLFSKGKNNSFADQLQNNLVSNLVANFISKLGLSESLSRQAANLIVPTLINLVTKENEKTPSHDTSPIQSIFSIGGKDADGLGSMLKGFFK